MVNIHPIVVIGPVGQEKHILIDNCKVDFNTNHAVAKQIRNDKLSIGGSGYFSQYALDYLGQKSILITSVGRFDHLLEQLSLQFPNCEIINSDKGYASDFLAVWDLDGYKQLYVRQGVDPSMEDIKPIIQYDEMTIIVLSLQNMENYFNLSEIAASKNRNLFVVPNQTLLSQPKTFQSILRTATAVFLSTAEVLSMSHLRKIDEINYWYQSHDPKAILIVTNSGESMSIFKPNTSVEILDVPKVDVPVHTLGGGDMFATITASSWDEQNLSNNLIEAFLATANLLTSNILFD